MSFTCVLIIIYITLIVIEVSSLIIGIKSNEWKLFIVVTVFTVILTAMLIYFWIKCPM